MSIFRKKDYEIPNPVSWGVHQNSVRPMTENELREEARAEANRRAMLEMTTGGFIPNPDLTDEDLLYIAQENAREAALEARLRQKVAASQQQQQGIDWAEHSARMAREQAERMHNQSVLLQQMALLHQFNNGG